MNVLNQRQINLINILANENDWLATNRAAELLNISVSTLRRDIDTVNVFYRHKDNRIDSKPGLGLKLAGSKVLTRPHSAGNNSIQEILKSKSTHRNHHRFINTFAGSPVHQCAGGKIFH